MNIVVLGGGPAGLSSSLALARAGHSVTLLERDLVEPHDSRYAFDRARRGIPHFRQPHQFIPRGRLEMLRNAPEVFQMLLDAGAEDVDLRKKLPGTPQPQDEELQHIAVRRPMIEWALVRAVAAEPNITVRSAVKVTGLLGKDGTTPVVTGARTDAGDVESDLVVDALGRTSPVPRWLEQLGAPPIAEQREDAGITYYSRYYRFRDGATLPEGPWILAPRGDLGYAGYSTIPGDNRTFAVIFAIGSPDKEMKVLYDARAFEAAAALIAPLHARINPDVAEPITGMLAMGGIDNMLRRYTIDGEPAVIGLVPVGDSWCHTDPLFAFGLPMALLESFSLPRALGDHAHDVRDTAAAHFAACEPEVSERYTWVAAFDRDRNRLWAGESLDPGRRDGSYPLFGVAAAGAAALVDEDVFRVFVRRNTFLDRLSVLDDDVAMQERIEKIFAELRAKPSPPAPSRDELLEVARAATGG